VDHTMQMGERKCLIILGLRQSAWATADERRLRQQDVEVIALQPVCESTGEVVAQQFHEAAQRTGVPRSIVSDNGRDLRRGLDLYCAQHPDTCWVYDIKHQTAWLLKRALENDPDWKSFAQQATRTKQQVYLTPLAFLAPPQQRGKARYMNVDSLVEWGQKTLRFLDAPAPTPDVAPAVLEEKLGWLRNCRDALHSWREVMDVIETTEHYVRTQGLHRQAAEELGPQLNAQVGGPLSCQFRDDLLAFVKQQSTLARPGERLLGSSEIIESTIGKYKRMQGEHSPHGLTGMILSIAANVGRRSTALLKTALQQVRTKTLAQWCTTHLGISVQSHRKTAFGKRATGTKTAPTPST